MATGAISHPPHHSVNNTSPKTSATPPHFCKDCEVMFESSTSLKVHLSYHKENLLSRWGPESNISNNSQQSNLESRQNDNNSQPQSNPQPPPASSLRDGGPPQQPYAFHPDYTGLGLYFPPQYNNNMVDRSNDSQITQAAVLSYRSIPDYANLDPYLYGGGGIPNGGNHGQFGTSQQKLFSSNHINGGGQNGSGIGAGTPRSGENLGTGSVKQERNETPAEILDLDSHKVHVYQHPSQIQGADPLSKIFYRPYLNQMLPPPPGNPNNTWLPPSQPNDQFPSAAFSSDLHGNMPTPHPYGLPPQSGGNVVYELVRGGDEGHRYMAAPGDLPPMGYSPQLGPLTPSFRGSFPPPPPNPADIVVNGVPMGVNGNSRNCSPPTKSPPTASPATAGPGGKKNVARAANANNAAPKTKGWKGGECKRPKTYNCTACNKWFTSSGHLKRHYGTTLHKNSVKQKGEGPEDQQQQPTSVGSGRKNLGVKKSPGDKMSTGGESNSMEGINSSTGQGASSPSSRVKHEDSTSSGKSTPVFGNNGNGISIPIPISNGIGRVGDFNTDSQISNPTYVGNPYMPYNCVQGPPLHTQYVLQNHFTSPGTVPFTNGFIPDNGPPIGVYSVPTSMGMVPPTSLYNGGYSVLANVNSENPPLPPFSSVGFSHYDPNTFAHMTAFPPHSSPNPVSQHRMTPNGGQIYHGEPLLSPQRSDGNNFGPDSHNSTNPLNRDSPEAVRSAASGSMEGSLDGICLSATGSPVHSVQSMSDISSGPESDFMKGECGDSSDQDRTESGQGLLKCPECSKTFGRSCYLTQHTNSSHSGGKPFKCSTCGKRFPEEPALSDHFAKHGSEKPYKCTLCPKQFNHKTDLRRHLCLHTGEKPFVCNVCGKGFIRKDHMSKHSETHRKATNSSKLKQQNNNILPAYNMNLTNDKF